MKFIVKESKCDLHIHTRFSDGQETIGYIIDEAIKSGLKCIAFTDHNIDEARFRFNRRELKKEYGLNVISGSELSVVYNGKRLHLLAYNYNSFFAKFILPKIGFMRDTGEPISLKKACSLIHMCGGKAVLAHPFKYRYNGKGLVKDLVEEKCLDGIECIHSYHTQEEIDYLLEVCEKNDLYVSGGSDFHYCGKKIRGAGEQCGISELTVTNSTVEKQFERAKQKYKTIKR